MRKETEQMTGAELLAFIARIKGDRERQAEREIAEAFFCLRYREALHKQLRRRFGQLSDADRIIDSVFRRVFKYPTFTMKKARQANEDAAICGWLSTILWRQLNSPYPDAADEAEDLPILFTLADFSWRQTELEESARQELLYLQDILQELGWKHQAVYLTYLFYRQADRRLPRSVTRKLQEELRLTQSSIRVYKQQAIRHVAARISAEKPPSEQ